MGLEVEACPPRSSDALLTPTDVNGSWRSLDVCAGQSPGLQLRGFANFVRHNPRSDKFEVHRFHSIEFWCSDATNTYKRFQHGLGMSLVAKSDLSTANSMFASYVLKSNDLTFVFTAPYSRNAWVHSPPAVMPLPNYNQQQAHEFVSTHGLAVRAVGLVVADSKDAFEASVANGAIPVLEPTPLTDEVTGRVTVISEVKLYGDVVLRYISGDYEGEYLPNYTPVEGPRICYGIVRLDHAVGNVHNLLETANYVAAFTGFHQFAEFTAEDVGTVDSGLNSMVLASNNELVLLPINEPTYGTPRKSQIQTYLEQNEGPGLQHLALKTNDIFKTLKEMQARSDCGGFEFMPRPSDKYYRELHNKIGDALTPEQYKMLEEMGILADRDDQGVLLQIFTKPLGDRPTIFIEIIERIGCMQHVPAASMAHATHKPDPRVLPAAAVEGTEPPAAVQGLEVDYETDKQREAAQRVPAAAGDSAVLVTQIGGCGGFGKGNFSELFKRIEDYERTLSIQKFDSMVDVGAGSGGSVGALRSGPSAGAQLRPTPEEGASAAPADA